MSARIDKLVALGLLAAACASPSATPLPTGAAPTSPPPTAATTPAPTAAPTNPPSSSSTPGVSMAPTPGASTWPTIRTSEVPIGIADAADTIWVATYFDGALQRIDPETQELLDPLPVGLGAIGVTSAAGFAMGHLARARPGCPR